MHEYSVADVERLIGLSRGMVRAMIRQRFVAPRRGRRREYRFSFQDLIVLRAAKALTNTRLSARRITRSLRELRRHLPEEAPLAGLSLRAVGDAVSVREGPAEWDSGSGQYLLALDVSVRNGSLHFVERGAHGTATADAPSATAMSGAAISGVASPGAGAEALFERALELAIALLAPGGTFVGKLFQGPDFKKLLDAVRARFATAKTAKPESSRQISIEQYIVGTGFSPR